MTDTPAPDPGIQVAITDLGTGDTEVKTIVDDVMVICAGNHHVTHVQKYSNGTSVWTIKTIEDT